jgi:polar amino acid transport system substrate-binding protein
MSNTRRSPVLIVAIAAALSLNVVSTFAQSYNVAVRQLATSDMYVNLIKAIGEAMNVTMNVQVMPGGRVNYLIENKQTDIILPDLRIPDPGKRAALKFDDSTVTMYNLSFVLYTNKAKPIDIADLKKGNKKGYKIETDVSQINTFEFVGIPTTNLDASLKKVNDGTIDGFIFSQSTGDAFLKKGGYKNVKRSFYGIYDMAFGLQKGQTGGSLDKLLTEGIARIKANKKYEAILGQAVKDGIYQDWQP